jgi:hypothetical protein
VFLGERMICQWCKQDKDETEFHWKFKNVERLKVCRDCRKLQSKRYRDRSKDKRLEYNRKYSAEHKEEIAEYMRKYHVEHIDNAIKRRIKRIDIIAEYNTRYYKEHKKESRERKKEWSKIHGDRNNHYAKKHNALKRGAPIADFTVKQWRELLMEYDNLCAYCGSDRKPLQEDHIQPVSKNGNHTKSNIVPACISCNSSKKDKTLKQWKRTIYFRENCINSRI